MRILILTHGSRGDVEPFAALSAELVEAGHDVIFGAPREYRDIIEPNCTDAILFPDRLHVAADHPKVRDGVNNNFRGLRGKINLLVRFRLTQKAAAGILDDFESVTYPDADILVHHGLIPTRFIADKLAIPAVPVGLAPGYLPTASFPYINLPFRIPSAFNRISYLWKYAQQYLVFFKHQKKILKSSIHSRFGRQMGTARKGVAMPNSGLQCFSSHVWPPQQHAKDCAFTTGYWFLPENTEWHPPQELIDFIYSGSAPVYIGFGSIASAPERVCNTIVEAIRLVGIRAIVGEGWEGLRIQKNHRIYLLKEAPFEWLFPKMSAVVHHGGIGTIGAALRAGRPQAIFPALPSTQAYARRVHSCGVGCFPQKYSELDATHLANAIRILTTNHTIIGRARQFGHKIRSENGTKNAVDLLEVFEKQHRL